MLQKGMKGTAHTYVTESNTASAMGSGSLDVFATPAMIALMEKASVNAVEKYLDKGKTTVGTMINAEHISATPINMKVTAVAEIIEVNGRETVFNITAEDETGIIGKAVHKRFTVDTEKFMNKTNLKK